MKAIRILSMVFIFVLLAEVARGQPTSDFGRAAITAEALEGDFLRDMRVDEARFMSIIMRVIMNNGREDGSFARFEAAFPKLVEAARGAYEQNDHRLAYLLACRIALLYNGNDINEGTDVATAYHFLPSARLIDPPNVMVLHLYPLFARKTSLEGKYQARFTLLDKQQPERSKLLGTVEISEMKAYSLEINTSGWKAGAYALRYDLIGPGGEVLIDGLQRRFQIVPGLISRLEGLQQAWEEVKGQLPDSWSDTDRMVARHTIEYNLRYVIEATEAYTGGTHQTGYPMVQRLRQQDESKRKPLSFREELEQVEKMLQLLANGTDPFREMRGELSLAYLPEGGTEPEPFRIYLPETLNLTEQRTLVVGLHGAGGNEKSFMQHYLHPETGQNILKTAMDTAGYILASPRGGGAYSYYRGAAITDVVSVTRILQDLYDITPERTLLMGHSMGGGGTLKIGLRFPDLFAALAPIAGGSQDIPAGARLPAKALQLPVFFSQGGKDEVVPASLSRAGAERLKALLPNFEYREYPDAAHNDVVGYALADILNFFTEILKK